MDSAARSAVVRNRFSRSLWKLGLILALPLPATAAPVEPPSAPPGLEIHGTYPETVFAPILRQYRAEHPSVEVIYRQADAAELYRELLRSSPTARTPDLTLSPAMDLQFKLANDGRARRHVATAHSALPRWAN